MIDNELINFIVKTYNQCWGFSSLPDDTAIVCLDSLDYFNTITKLEPELCESYKKLPAILINDNGHNHIYVNTNKIINENRYFSLEVFLSILSSVYIENIDSVKSITNKTYYFVKTKIQTASKIVKDFFCNVMSLKVLEIVFSDEETTPYSNNGYKTIISKITEEIEKAETKEDKMSLICYLFSRIKMLQNQNYVVDFKPFSSEMKNLYNLLSDFSFSNDFTTKNLLKINRCYSKI